MVETSGLKFNPDATLDGWVFLAKLVNLSLIYFQDLWNVSLLIMILQR